MGELTKILIKSYTDEELQSSSKEFTLPVNPESYSRSLKVNYDDSQAQGAEKNNSKFTSTEAEEIKIDFFFDGTGTIQNYVKDLLNLPVSQQIEDFLEVVYKMEGEIHKPKFLKLNWGKFVFDCVLKALDINYTLFNSQGEPLRAKLSGTFQGYVNTKKRVRLEDKRSPDLSHVKQVLEGDRLDLMTWKIYGDTAFFTQIARVNNLSSLRNLKVKQELIFPPIEKNEV